MYYSTKNQFGDVNYYMKVFVDADSFLKQMRDIVLRAAIKRNLDITFVADRSLKDVLIASESHTSILRKETLSNNPKIEKEELKKSLAQ